MSPQGTKEDHPMAKAKKRSAIPGSERAAVAGATVIGAPDPKERIEVTVVLRRRPSSEPFAPAEKMGSRLPGERQYIKREEFAGRHGAHPDDVAKITKFAAEHNLKVEEVSLARRSVRLSGTAKDLSAAFGTKLVHYQHAEGAFRSRTGPLTVTSGLEKIIEGVFGLTNRPVAKPHYRRRDSAAGGIRPHAQATPFTPIQVAGLYDFPTAVDGTGECIGIIELDTPSDPNQPAANVAAGFSTDDLTAYFAQLGIAAPSVTVVSVDGGQNLPGVNTDADGEVTLDIEVAGAVAPGARIAVYFAPNTDQGFLDAVNAALHDTVRRPSVISISWGGPESSWTAQSLKSYDSALQSAAAVGVTVCVAAGDNGSTDGASDGLDHVDFPASSPYALACGGTTLKIS